MADGADPPGGGGRSALNNLPEVVLNWSDFVFSLEKLRHKPYCKSTTERDWFRINPLEIIYIGARSLTSVKGARKEHGTMVLVMESQLEEMKRRPRYWVRLLQVLLHTCEGREVPNSVIQTCLTEIISIWKSLEALPEFFPSVCWWMVTQCNMSAILQRVLSQHSVSLGPLASEVELLVLSLDDVSYSSFSTSGVSPEVWQPWLGLITEGGEELPPEISQLIGLMVKTTDKSDENFEDVFNQCKEDVMSVLNYYVHRGNYQPLSALLSIVQLIMVRWGSEWLASDNEEDSGSDYTVQQQLNSLFETMSSSLRMWQSYEEKSMSRDQTTQSHDQREVLSSEVPEKLLRLVWIILCRNSLSSSIQEATVFLHEVFPVLVEYSTEGYLASIPDLFLCELLEYVSSLVEHGTPPLEALHVNLPNLFGQAFGFHSHQVSCKLLQYGYLTVCSQHKKSLLSEGLNFLFKVFRLFPPVDEIKGKKRAAKLREEAVTAAGLILEELLASLPAGSEEESKDSNEQEADEGGEEECVEEDGLDSFDVSDDERRADKAQRQCILLGLLELACAMIRSGENISFLYASCLPKLLVVNTEQESGTDSGSGRKITKFFGETPPVNKKGIPWRVDLKELAIRVLELSVLCLENTSVSPFQLCGIVLPKLVTNLDMMELPDSDKFSLTMSVLAITMDTIKEGHSVEHLTNYGIDLLSMLLPPSASSDDLKLFISQIASHFVSPNQGSLLYLIKSACNFMLKAFRDEASEIRQLFHSLLFKGKRDEIRGLYRICRESLCEGQYGGLRQHLYRYSTSKMNHRQFTALCELMLSAMDVSGTSKSSVREVVSNEQEEDEAVVKERRRVETIVLDKLTSPCMTELELALNEGRFKRDVWEGVASQLSRVALFRALFLEEFHLYHQCSNNELLAIFQSKFPAEVQSDDEMMQLLSVSTTRIEHMQVPRYSSLKKMLSNILQYFLTCDVNPPGTSDADSATPVAPSSDSVVNGGLDSREIDAPDSTCQCLLDTRKRCLQQYLDQLPRNKDDREQLLSSGYSPLLWEKGVYEFVQTDGSLSLEENLRQNLLACFTEFADILKQMAVTHVSVDGEMVKVVNLFTEDLSLTSLKGRRALAVRMIDQCRGGAMQGHFYERKAALLSKEDQIEAEFETMARAAIKPKTFTIRLNTTFFDCARCCGSKIIGCYVPNGEHCERPLEIGMRTDSAIASIYDEDGKEIENSEVLFMEEGVFFFKAYTNGHPYDTSQVWLQFFSLLLDQGQSGSSLVPAIIIPRGYPNQRTWEALRRTQSTEMTGSLLSVRLDFSPEWRTYYDYRPDRVRIGTDMILHSGFKLHSDQSRPALQRQVSRFTKDLAGVIFEEIFQDMLSDDWLKQFRFLGKVISQYISTCVSEGGGDLDVLTHGFDYDRWRKTYSRTKQPPRVPDKLSVPSDSPVPTKESICQHLAGFLDNGIVEWCGRADLVQMCSNSHKQLLELKCFLEKAKGDFQQPAQLNQLKCVLNGAVKLVPILSLPESLQEEIMHWIFHNEDRVWRYRGGRSGHETLQQFMNFLGQSSAGESGGAASSNPASVTTPYPGVALFFLPELAQGFTDFDPTRLQVRQMVSYATGETLTGKDEDDEDDDKERSSSPRRRKSKLVGVSYYEIVTAWVHPRFRGMNFSWVLYSTVFEQAPARLIMFDVLQGSVERIIASNSLLTLLDRLGLSRMIIHSRHESYTVTTQVGEQEKFERVMIYTRPLRVALRIHKMVKVAKENPKTTAAIIMATFGIPATVGVAFGLYRM